MEQIERDSGTIFNYAESIDAMACVFEDTGNPHCADKLREYADGIKKTIVAILSETNKMNRTIKDMGGKENAGQG